MEDDWKLIRGCSHLKCALFLSCLLLNMSTVQQRLDEAMAKAQPKKKTFRKQIYRGVELEKLMTMPTDSVIAMFRSRQRRRMRNRRHSNTRYDRLIKKLVKAVKDTPVGEKPKPVKTHLRNCIIMPEMVSSVCEVYSGKYWNPVEIKTDMVGDYLGEYSMTYKPIRHGKVGHGATKGSKFVAIK